MLQKDSPTLTQRLKFGVPFFYDNRVIERKEFFRVIEKLNKKEVEVGFIRGEKKSN